MKSVIAFLAVALTFSGALAAPAACPKKETAGKSAESRWYIETH